MRKTLSDTYGESYKKLACTMKENKEISENMNWLPKNLRGEFNFWQNLWDYHQQGKNNKPKTLFEWIHSGFLNERWYKKRFH